MAMPPEVRVWRPAWPGRIAALGFFAIFVALAVVWLVAKAPVWLHLLALLPAAAAVIPLRIAGAKVVLTPDFVLIRNPFDVHRVPLDQITSVTNLPRGSVKITTASGGRRIEAWAVRTPMMAWILRRRSRANELMDAIEDAAPAYGAPISSSRLRHAVGAAAPRIPMAASAEPSMIMTGHTGARFPRHKWYPGYQVPAVDEFMARIEASLIGGPKAERAVTAADVRAARFATTRRGGYDQFVVDEALDRYASELDRLAPPGNNQG
jgi:DivIVA domain-containing protein